jgi:Mn2+/Fe2+ NRAMP family transporter
MSVRPDNTSPRSKWLAFGPGLLFAGAAVGVSHLVQSTRGGAEFGLVAVLIVATSCLIKWPAFRFGPLYAALTGDTLLDGYRRRGRWTLVIFGLMTLAICFTTLAAVTSVTAGLLINLIPGVSDALGSLPGPLGRNVTGLVSVAVLGGVAAALLSGGYRLLDRIMKLVMPVLAFATLLAAIIALPALVASGFGDPAALGEPEGQQLAVAMIGWMPAPIDIAVWSSIWTIARARTAGRRGTTDSILLDFDAGYLSTLVLAIAFAMLGAAVMHGRGESFEGSSVAFAGQVMDLYASQLGGWTRPVIGLAAFLTMLSTTIAVADGFPRTAAAFVEAWKRPVSNAGAKARTAGPKSVRDDTIVPNLIMSAIADSIQRHEQLAGKLLPSASVAVSTERAETSPDAADLVRSKAAGDPKVYWIAFGVIGVGAALILLTVLGSQSGGFKALVDLVTIVSFLVAPILVLFNHLCIMGAEVPSEHRPSMIWQAWSWLAFGSTAIFAAIYAFTLLKPWLISLAVAPTPAG